MSITQFNTQMNKKLSGMKQAQPAAVIQKKQGNTGMSADMLGMQNQLRNMQGVQKVKTFDNAYNNYLQKSAPAALQPTVVTPAFSNDVDYAAQIQQLAAMPVTAENKASMQKLLAGRNAKIAAGGAALAQYANDDVTKTAQQYLKQYAPADAGTAMYYDRADALADENYTAAEASLAKQQSLQLENMKRTYEQARREADLAYAMKSRAIENVLANQGLGRGLGAAPSSGYSETARMGALADYANSINQTYAQQDAAARELAAQYELQRMQAMLERNAAKQNTLLARANQANADREFGLAAHQFNTGLGAEDEARKLQALQIAFDEAYRNKVFDYGKERDAVDDARWLEEFDYGRERDLVEDSHWQAAHELDRYNTYNKSSGRAAQPVTVEDSYDAALAALYGEDESVWEQALRAPLADDEIKRTVGFDENGDVVIKTYPKILMPRGSAAANNASRDYQPSWQVAGWNSSSSFK